MNPFRVDASQIQGFGMFTNRSITEGEMFPLTGLFIESEELAWISFDIDGHQLVPDAPFRYMNHSDRPDAEVWCDENGSVWLLMLNDSPPDCEVFINYGYDPMEGDT